MSPQSVLSWIPVVRELASLFAELWRMPQEQRHAQARASADCARAAREAGEAARRSSEATERKTHDTLKSG